MQWEKFATHERAYMRILRRKRDENFEHRICVLQLDVAPHEIGAGHREAILVECTIVYDYKMRAKIRIDALGLWIAASENGDELRPPARSLSACYVLHSLCIAEHNMAAVDECREQRERNAGEK